SGGCFRAPRMASVCGSPNWGIRWFIRSQCKPTGTWTFNLKNNGVVFKTAYVDLLPKVGDVNDLARRFAENQGTYLQPYDGICYPKTGSKAVNCQDPNATTTPYTIAAKGCAITAVDMVMKYHGRSIGFTDVPVDINSFLDRSPNIDPKIRHWH
ncbi:MAG: hypothetical protein Q9M29_03710, partial [Mariprofundaceae bacterium]|nr:hypothetical protein [Mariprofundaceae bacterium]